VRALVVFGPAGEATPWEKPGGAHRPEEGEMMTRIVYRTGGKHESLLVETNGDNEITRVLIQTGMSKLGDPITKDVTFLCSTATLAELQAMYATQQAEYLHRLSPEGMAEETAARMEYNAEISEKRKAKDAAREWE
jgi:hypothetical protein